MDKSLQISEEIHGKEHLDVVTAEAALAQAYLGERNFKKAEPLVNDAIATGRKLLGDMHCGFAKLLVVAGTLKEKERRAIEAEDYYRRALHIFRRNLSRDHPDLVDAGRQYAHLIKSFKN